MQSITVFAISFLFGACIACGTDDRSTEPIPTPTEDSPFHSGGPTVDKVLQPYVTMFMNDCEVRRTDCQKNLDKIKEIKVVEMEDKDKDDMAVTVGLCYLGIFSRRIHINKIALDYPGRYMQTLVYHELGHCMYGLDHEKKPDMLMSEVMPKLFILVREWDYLLSDFFAAIEEENGP